MFTVTRIFTVPPVPVANCYPLPIRVTASEPLAKESPALLSWQAHIAIAFLFKLFKRPTLRRYHCLTFLTCIPNPSHLLFRLEEIVHDFARWPVGMQIICH